MQRELRGVVALVTTLSVVGTAAAELYGNLDIVGLSSAKVTPNRILQARQSSE